MKVLITGGSRGLGKSLAKNFAKHGDHVIICARNPLDLHTAQIELQTFATTRNTHARIDAFVADVSDPHAFDSIEGSVDVWINNAGTNGYQYAMLANQDPELLKSILDTNLLGAAYGYQHAIRCGARHVFFMMGGGAKGEATPTFGMYGASKRGAYHLVDSLRLESPSHLRLHRVFPGFVDTPLLTSGADDAIARTVFDVLARHPDEAGEMLERQIRHIAQHNSPSSDICVNSLTIKAIGRLCLRLLSID